MDVLILAGYRQDLHSVLLKRPTSNSPLFLDQQIKATQALGLNPIVVLSGNHADEVLRQSKALRSCELIFDTNDHEAGLMTNLKAGVQVISNTGFILPVEVPCPEKAAWVALKQAYQRTGFSTQKAVVQLTDSQGAPWHWGFPLYLTRLGRHLLLNESDLHSLVDPRLTYFHSVFEPPEGLAPQGHNL